MNSTIRSYWWDTALIARYLKLKGMRLWWHPLSAWEKATPAFYRKIQSSYRRQRPDLETQISADAYGSVVTVDGIQMRVDPKMTPFQVQKLIEGRHTREERRLLIHRLDPDDVVMELGGGIGMLAIACALKIGGDRVHF